ncbi:aspartyl protease family protein [Mucilaginibacter gotjawali]|uniref:Aspartyl protease n=1 Tax=Mucilaginibacter gotjawali TaxID=1550579 RepID=A0A839SIX5_9SPHI|nr:aspartyl protease family protein [Mucilaginibacter gotjawali]MBB3056820.1 putative aspartyl protease [Mucilaginibacter gotjawali]
MSYNLKVLTNGLVICEISVVNPGTGKTATCNALIDTGAEITLLCPSVFDELEFNDNQLAEGGTSSLDGDGKSKVAIVDMKLPSTNWTSFRTLVYRKDISKRVEYDAIIGVNILRNYQFVYHGAKKTAWLDEV